MPKDEFDFDDPMELNGMAFQTNEDTSEAMCECFVEEFLRLGHGPKQILALFRNPHYLGMNLVMQKRGESFIREVIAEQFARRGRSVSWPSEEAALRANESGKPDPCGEPVEAQSIPLENNLTDPMGAAIPLIESVFENRSRGGEEADVRRESGPKSSASSPRRLPGMGSDPYE
jgi:hypothetical protein